MHEGLDECQGTLAQGDLHGPHVGLKVLRIDQVEPPVAENRAEWIRISPICPSTRRIFTCWNAAPGDRRGRSSRHEGSGESAYESAERGLYDATLVSVSPRAWR